RASDFHEALANAVLFAGTNPIRPTIAAVCIEFQVQHGVQLIATDTYGLVRIKLPCSVSGTSGDFLLDVADAKRVLKLLKGVKWDDVGIEVDGDSISFTSGG